jgi:hypothetical protein
VKLGIVMPVVLQNEEMLHLTIDAVKHLKSRHDMDLYVMCNRLHVCTPEVLQFELRRLFQGYLLVVHRPGIEGSVASAWNDGFRLAIRNGCEVLMVVANDTKLCPACLDILAHHVSHTDADLCSGISVSDRSTVDATAVTDGPDFSCFAMLPKKFAKHGQFDTNFRPAYFEDNDYHARIVMGGGRAECVHAAQFAHVGSATVKFDKAMEKHVAAWFDINRDYFIKKWGTGPVGSPLDMRVKYFKTPYNMPGLPLSWFSKPAV